MVLSHPIDIPYDVVRYPRSIGLALWISFWVFTNYISTESVLLSPSLNLDTKCWFLKFGRLLFFFPRSIYFPKFPFRPPPVSVLPCHTIFAPVLLRSSSSLFAHRVFGAVQFSIFIFATVVFSHNYPIPSSRCIRLFGLPAKGRFR